MKVLVVDEERWSIRKLERILRNIDSSIRIVGAVPTLVSSAEWLNRHEAPDLILVNKELMSQPSSKASVSKINTTVTFSIRSDHYTFQAYRFNNLPGFFKKPVSPKEETVSLSVLNGKQGIQIAGSRTKDHRRRFLVKQGQKFASIETSDIAYFFSDGRFIFFKTFDEQKYLVEYTLEELEEMLSPHDFFRINRSLLLSFKCVEQIHPYFGNRMKLYLNPSFEKDVIVSREKVNDFKTWLGQ